MPTPGFPDWLGPGAVVRELATLGPWVVMNVELVLPNAIERTHGHHDIALRPLFQIVREPLRYGVLYDDLRTLGLDEFLEHYSWTGEHLMPDGTLVGTGTTMPVTMHMGAIAPNQRLVIQGSAEYDGEYLITSVSQGYGGGPELTIGINNLARLGAGWLPGAVSPFEPEPTREDFGDTEDPDVTYDPTPSEMLQDQRMTAVQVMSAMGMDTSHLITDPPYSQTPSVIEGERPIVESGQVWLLPVPNQGLWRTEVISGRVVTAPIRLTHQREAHRVMNCSARWLVEHGVRQAPPDPRPQRPGQVAYGQVWEFAQEGVPVDHGRARGRFRVMEINERAGRARLHAEDGSGKRIYMPPADILRNAMYVGDGLPRRTAFERVLEDDEEDVRE